MYLHALSQVCVVKAPFIAGVETLHNGAVFTTGEEYSFTIMKQFTQIAYLSLLWIVALGTSASAQEAPTVSPNFEVRYNSEGAGVESNGSVEGFIPLFQTPGQNATFLQGRLFLDDDSQMGGNVLLGYRVYDKKDDRVTGAYVSFDARDTSRSYFKQLGIGFETLGKWDLRINGYLPLGETRNQIGQFYFGNPFFKENNIVIQQANLFEAALHGIDAEVGTRLTKIGSGDLRGYAGIYYLGNDNKEAFGWKARVEARPTKFLSLGASLQNDSLFDTRAAFTVGLSFPGSGAIRGNDEKPSYFARMGEFVERQTAIPVVGVNTVASVALTNPNTNKPWSFIHVAPGNSNGTAESPYSYDKIQQALNDAAAKTDSIVYIRGDEKAIIPGFTLLSGVQLLTNTPERFINTVEIGNIKLPFSGSRIVPKIGGIVTLSSNTVFSGFDINAANGAGVRGTNISNIKIADNRIQGTQGEAILLSQVTGNVDISNNTIDKSTGSALLLTNTSGNANIKVTGNNITDNLNSIGINLGGTATGTAEIAKNTISNFGIGVDVSLSDSANLSKLNITDNSITAPNNNNSLTGIQIEAFDKATATANITGNTISNTTNDGISIQLNQNTKTQVNISNNKIENVKGSDLYALGGAAFADGIDVQLFDSANAGVSITGNTVNNTTGRGISASNIGNVANLKLDITGNTVSNTEYEGIGIDSFNGNITINKNTVSNGKGDGLYLGNIIGNAEISGLEINDAGAGVRGINVNNIKITDSRIQNIKGTGVDLQDVTGKAEINKLNVNGAVGAGIHGTNLNNVTITNSNIQGTTGTGTISPTQGEAILLSEVTGNVDISNNTIGKNAGSAVSLNNTFGNANIKVTGNNISDNLNSIGIKLGGTTTGTAEIAKNTISNFGSGVDVSLSENANLSKLDIANNSITAPNSNNPLEGIKFKAFDEAVATVNVTGNTISNTTNDGIGVQVNQNTKTQVNISSNKIDNVKGSDLYGLGGTEFADGIDIQVFDSASSKVSITGNTVNNTTGNGISISDNSDTANQKLDIANNTVSNTEYEGIGIDGVDGNITISQNTVSNTKYEGIYLENTTGKAEISGSNNISGATGAGIRGTNVSNVTITGNSIQGTTRAGTNSNTDGEGVILSEATGNVDISNNTITKNEGSAVSLNNTSGNADIKVTGNNITDNLNSIGIKLGGTTTGTAEIAKNTISNFGIGVDVSLSESANLSKLDIANNSITAPNSNNPLEGIKLRAFDEAVATVNVTGNIISNTTNDSINVGLNQNTETQINISNNKIENVKGSDAYGLGGAANADGIDVQLFDSASSRVSITTNTINNTTGRGISTSNTSDADKARLDIVANTISNTEYEGIGIDEFNGNVTVNNNNIYNASTEAISLGNITGKVDINALNINGGNSGIRVTNVNEITIADSNIQNTKTPAIDLENVTGEVEISGLNISSSTGAGISGTNVNNVTITGSSIQGTQGEGILLSGVTGDVDISNNTLTKNTESAVSLSNTSGNADIKVTGNNITDNFNSIGINLGGTATGTAEIAKNTISNPGIGVDVTLSETANLSKLDITDNSITASNSDNPLEGIKLRAFDETIATVNVTGNNIRNTTSDAIGVGLNQNTKTQVNIANNKIENVQGSDSYGLGGAEFADGIDLQLFDSASSGISITGNTVNNTTGSGIIISDYSDAANQKLDIANNSVSNTEYEGIGIDGVDGNITVSKNTISNTKYEGISLENTTGKAEISEQNISGATGAGIRGTNVNNVTITGSSIQGTQGEGILLSEVTGNVDISNNTLTKNTESAVSLSNTSGNADIKVTGNNITDNFNSIGINLGGTATGTAEITKNTISNPGIGVDVTLSETANLSKLDITDNSITAPNSDNPLEGIKLRAFDEATATVNVTGNTISNTTNDGINVGLNQNTNTNINIANNKIENVKGSDAYSLGGAEFADGIDVQLFDSANSKISVTDNTVNKTTGNGISISNLSDAANVDLNVTGNTVSNTEYQGIRVDNFDSNTTVNNNTVTNAVSEGIYLENTTGKVEINDNKVVDTRDPSTDTDLESGIFVWNYGGDSDYTIANNTIETTFDASGYRTDGIEFNLCRDVDPIYLGNPCNSTATAKVNITNNTIKHNGNVAGGADGIDLNIGKFADATFNVTGNTVSNIPDEAVSIGAVADSKGIFNINNNTITNVVDSGIEVDLFLPDPAVSPALNLFNSSNTEFNITGNTIDTAKDDGINFEVQDQANTKVTITGNTIQNIGSGENGDRAIQLETFNSSNMCAAVDSNTISASPRPALLRPSNASTLEVVDAANLSTRNGGASFSTPGTTNRLTPCP